MALALQERDRQFNTRFMNAYRLLASNPTAALPELEWAEQEHTAIEQQRIELDTATDKMRTEAGITLTPQDAATREAMAMMSHDTGSQIQCGKATALVQLNRLAEARKVVDAAFESLRSESSPEARKMLLQMRATLIASAVPGL
jgi:hypothetical protein